MTRYNFDDIPDKIFRDIKEYEYVLSKYKYELIIHRINSLILFHTFEQIFGYKIIVYPKDNYIEISSQIKEGI